MKQTLKQNVKLAYMCATLNLFLYKIQDIKNTGAELVQYFCANTQLKTFNGG